MTDNMRIWQAVEKTDPAHTKHVSQRGGFTAINANYQIMQATKQFGPIGIGWGYVSGEPVFHDTLLFVPVTLWYGDRSNTFGPMLGCEEWKSDKGRVDSDASKKATTDAITKLLSQLGFSADVFLGKYDNQKYVEELAEEFADKHATINDAQIAELQTLIENAPITSQDFLNMAKISALPELRADWFEQSKAWIVKKIEKAKETV